MNCSIQNCLQNSILANVYGQYCKNHEELYHYGNLFLSFLVLVPSSSIELFSLNLKRNSYLFYKIQDYILFIPAAANFLFFNHVNGKTLIREMTKESQLRLKSLLYTYNY